MLDGLKQITKSHKLRILVLFMALVIVAAVVVFAFDGTDEYQEYGGNTSCYEYTLQADDYEYYVGYSYSGDEYDNNFYYSSDGGNYIGFSTFEEYMYYMAGEAGDAPIMMFDLDDE